ncbi:MAG: hypothetical protein RIM72_14420 [Alphaproteobacteria bacterium]
MVDTIALTAVCMAGICFSVAYLVDGMRAYPPVWVLRQQAVICAMAPVQMAMAKRMCRRMSKLAGDAVFPTGPMKPVERRLADLTRRSLRCEARGCYITAYRLLHRALSLAAKHGTKTLFARQAGWLGLFLCRGRAIAKDRAMIETAATLTAASFIYGRTALDLYAVYDDRPRRVSEIDWRIRLAGLCDDPALAYRLHREALAIEQTCCTKGVVKKRHRLMASCAKAIGDFETADRHDAAAIPYTPDFFTIKRKAEELEYSADEAYRYGQFSRSLRLMHEAEPLILEYLAIAEDEDPGSASQFRDAYKAFKSKYSRYDPRTKPAAPLQETPLLAAAE